MTTKEVIDVIFKDPNTQYQLSEFNNLGKPIEQILSIYSKEITSGKDAGKMKYFLNDEDSRIFRSSQTSIHTGRL